MTDFGLKAHNLAEEHLVECFDDDSFCGCPTCIVREVLTAAWPAIDEYCNDAGVASIPPVEVPHA